MKPIVIGDCQMFDIIEDSSRCSYVERIPSQRTTMFAHQQGESANVNPKLFHLYPVPTLGVSLGMSGCASIIASEWREGRTFQTSASSVCMNRAGFGSALTLDECNRNLREWTVRHGKEDEDGLLWPSSAALRATFTLLSNLSDFPLPMFMVPDGEGGVMLEWRRAKHSLRIMIGLDGDVLAKMFRNSKIVVSQ